MNISLVPPNVHFPKAIPPPDHNTMITIGVLVAAVVILVAYDLYALKKGGVKMTLSSVLIRYSRTIPAIPFAFGLLMGHIFL